MTYLPVPPNGIALPSTSNPVVTPVQSVIGTAQATPALNYEFLTNSTNGWFDALGFSWVSFTIIPSAGVTGGVLSFESTNDPTSAPNGVPHIVQDSAVTACSRSTSVTLATTVRQFETPLAARYIRIRVSTAIPTGTVSLAATFRHKSPPMSTQALNTLTFAAGSATLGTVGVTTGTANIGPVLLASSTITDIAVASIGSGVTNTVINLANQTPAASFAVNVSAASGTSPTLDVIIQESYDGVSFVDLYHFERITAAGSYTTPTIRLNGAFIRYVRTVGGTSPSFTCAVVRQAKSSSGQIFRTFYDRTVVPNTISSATSPYLVHGCTQMRMAISSAAATTPCIIALQGSEDGLAWWDTGTLATAANTTQSTAIITFVGKWVRGIVTTAGSGQTLNYVQFTGIGPT